MPSKKVTKTPRITAVDLFCGVGGLTHGLMRGGVKVAAGVDFDGNCRYPFEANNSATFIEKDVGALEPADIRPFFNDGGYSLLAGCAPCQPFSTYSRKGRNGNYEDQWPLVLKFASLVNDLKPDLITMENVPQLADHPVFEVFLENLKGYNVWWSVVECSAFAIPQTRKRLVLLGSKLGTSAPKLIPANEHQSVRQAIGSLPKIKAGEQHPLDPLHTSSALSEINLRRIKASKPGGSWRDWPSELQASCHQKVSGATYPSVYGRMEWDSPGPTITTQCFGYGNGRFGHPQQDRAISLREAAILQTFPEDYRFVREGEKVIFNKLGRLIGNAVPVRLGEVIAKALTEHVREIHSVARCKQ